MRFPKFDADFVTNKVSSYESKEESLINCVKLIIAFNGYFYMMEKNIGLSRTIEKISMQHSPIDGHGRIIR